MLFVPQVGDDWGIRQTNLLRWGSEHGYARTVLTASDSPQMSRCAIELAFDLLHDADVVIGRVHDGGYYLIGLRGFHDVLTGVPMSTRSAADTLVARAESMGLRVAEVPGTFDVDIEADLDLLIELLDEHPEAAHATLQALRDAEPDSRPPGGGREPAERMLNDMQQTNATDLYDPCYPPPDMKRSAKPQDRYSRCRRRALLWARDSCRGR